VASVDDFQGLTLVPHELIHYHVTRVENVLPVECQDFQSSTIFPESHHSIHSQSVDDWIEENDFLLRESQGEKTGGFLQERLIVM